MLSEKGWRDAGSHKNPLSEEDAVLIASRKSEAVRTAEEMAEREQQALSFSQDELQEMDALDVDVLDEKVQPDVPFSDDGSRSLKPLGGEKPAFCEEVKEEEPQEGQQEGPQEEVKKSSTPERERDQTGKFAPKQV